MSVLVRFDIQGGYVKPLSVDARYSHRNAENLLQPVQMHLSQKLKIL